MSPRKVCLGEIGSEFESLIEAGKGFAEASNGFVQPALLGEHVTQVGMSSWRIRSQRQGSSATRDCFVQFAVRPERSAQIHVGVSIIRRERNRPLVARNGLG